MALNSFATCGIPGAADCAAEQHDALFEKRVESALVVMAYARSPTSLGMTAAAWVIFVGVLWPHFAPQHLLAWGAAVLGTAAARCLLWWFHA